MQKIRGVAQAELLQECLSVHHGLLSAAHGQRAAEIQEVSHND